MKHRGCDTTSLALYLAPTLALLLAPLPARGEVLRVPEHYATIQAALDAAFAGDAVVVGPGIYREILNLPDSVRVESDPPHEAIIVGEAHLHFLRETVITGFTVVSDYGGIHSFGGEGNRVIGNVVTGGTDPVGPGITCFNTSPLIEGNVVFRRGGIGIYCVESSPHIIGNTLVENGAGDYPRAGVHCGPGSSPRIERNIIAWGRGPAIHCEPGAAPLVMCNDLFGNEDGDQVCATDGGGNISLDPRFCDLANGDLSLRTDSPCATQACGVIGARGVACVASAVEQVTWGSIKARLRP